jgi:hypothetical protein
MDQELFHVLRLLVYYIIAFYPGKVASPYTVLPDDGVCYKEIIDNL